MHKQKKQLNTEQMRKMYTSKIPNPNFPKRPVKSETPRKPSDDHAHVIDTWELFLTYIHLLDNSIAHRRETK